VRDLTGHPDFAVQLAQAHRIAIHVGRQELQGDGLAELEIIGAKHLAHAAHAQPADDAIAATEKGAGRKASMVNST